MAADINDYLSDKPDGALVREIVAALAKVRRSPVLDHSVRSAIYQHMDGQGDGLFVRVAHGRYRRSR
jgi:hypothetical protein